MSIELTMGRTINTAPYESVNAQVREVVVKPSQESFDATAKLLAMALETAAKVRHLNVSVDTKAALKAAPKDEPKVEPKAEPKVAKKKATKKKASKKKASSKEDASTAGATTTELFTKLSQNVRDNLILTGELAEGASKEERKEAVLKFFQDQLDLTLAEAREASREQLLAYLQIVDKVFTAEASDGLEEV